MVIHEMRNPANAIEMGLKEILSMLNMSNEDVINPMP